MQQRLDSKIAAGRRQFAAPIAVRSASLQSGKAPFPDRAKSRDPRSGFIDYVLNFSKSNTTNPLLVIVVGLVYAVLYYFIFSFFITRFDLATPGRGEASTGLSSALVLVKS